MEWTCERFRLTVTALWIVRTSDRDSRIGSLATNTSIGMVVGICANNCVQHSFGS